ncbi:hypothetical protein AZSI13_16560 [Azospira sp. I13]|uniref:3'-5' exoribonuclease n=1 Tax=Azospira sp. I13 TaxID=1765050 RepID=UPI000D4B30E5|nr:3'-5' exoribonuclease [Azospira sp. I13]GBG02329.1 hypothetical protein AZSI13_16560 [Azospira sp. I13]
MTIVFFDTEFTHLGIDPKLISIGLVSEDGSRTFYAELTDTYRLEDCSDFVRDEVLPLLEGGACQMRFEEVAHRLSEWLLDFGDRVVLATDSESYDWPWIQKLFWKLDGWPIWVTPKPLLLTVGDESNQILESTLLRPHHALNDAQMSRLHFRKNT